MPSKNLSDVVITFKGASNVPIGDLATMSSDPYLFALLFPRTPLSPEHPPFPLTYRTTPKRDTRNPEWNEAWHLGGIPNEGFDMEMKIYDENKPWDCDNRLGVVDFSVNKLPSATADGKPGEAQEFELKIKKRKASRRAYAATYLVAWYNRDFKKQRGRVTISIQNLGKSTCTRNCPCVLGPMRWSVHRSPLIGRLAGTQVYSSDPTPLELLTKKAKEVVQKAQEKRKTKSSSNSYCFEANKLQLLGTIPKDLRYKYIPYRPLLAWIFSGKGIRGWIFQRAVHVQYRKIFCYDAATRYGLISSPPEVSNIEAGDAQSELLENQKLHDADEFAASKQFLEMVHYDETPPGGRMYAYVITLQGEWRFTETGPEFSIQFLSKHAMHSDISHEVACAGEFFIRRRRGRDRMKSLSGDEKPKKNEENDCQPESQGVGTGERNGEKGDNYKEECKYHRTKVEENDDMKRKGDTDNGEEGYHNGGGSGYDASRKPRSSDHVSKQDSVQVSNKRSHKVGRSRDPRNFVLIIDNDSGTYRPDSKTLPSLQKYLSMNLPGLKVKAMAWDDKKLKKWKQEQKPKKKLVKEITVAEASSCCSSSSGEDN